MQSIKATSFLGSTRPIVVSVITVAQASIIPNAESIPSVKRVKERMIVQKLGAGKVSIADG